MSGQFGSCFEDRPKEGSDAVTVPEGRIPRVIQAIERLESCRDIESHLRIIHALQGGVLVVTVVASDLARFHSQVIIPLGDYRPRFNAAYDYGSGEIRAEFTFEP